MGIKFDKNQTIWKNEVDKETGEVLPSQLFNSIKFSLPSFLTILWILSAIHCAKYRCVPLTMARLRFCKDCITFSLSGSSCCKNKACLKAFFCSVVKLIKLRYLPNAKSLLLLLASPKCL
jgi:hypothetical protein